MDTLAAQPSCRLQIIYSEGDKTTAFYIVSHGIVKLESSSVNINRTIEGFADTQHKNEDTSFGAGALDDNKTRGERETEAKRLFVCSGLYSPIETT
jgi:hypothetical protein